MKTDYKNINSFDVAVVGMIASGFVILGLILFASLTPRQQANISSSFKLFDIHEEALMTGVSAAETFQFVWEAPSNFYNEFYIAFEEVMTVPAENFETPVAVVKELGRNISSAFYNLSEQASTGFAVQSQYYAQSSPLAQISNEGKIMGAIIKFSDKVENMTVTQKSSPSSLNLTYNYVPPNLDQFNSALKFLNK